MQWIFENIFRKFFKQAFSFVLFLKAFASVNHQRVCIPYPYVSIPVLFSRMESSSDTDYYLMNFSTEYKISYSITGFEMNRDYVKEEVVHSANIPALIKYQRLSGPECSVPLHWHKEIELNLMLVGCGEFMINGKKTVLEEGNLLIVNSEDLHMGEPPSSIPVEERVLELITVLWDYEFLWRYTKKDRPLRFDLNRCSPETRGKIIGMVRQIGTLHLENRMCCDMDITALLLQIGSCLIRHCMVEEEDVTITASQRQLSALQDAVRYIDENYAFALTLEDVAERAGFSPAYFSKKFRTVTGVTYKEYLTKVRLKQALRDLRVTERTINEIAYSSGFPNIKSFIELFKKEYQTTPQKYRRSFQSQAV